MTPLFRKLAFGCFVGALASGCDSPLHLTYDHGRAYTEAFTSQPDLTRPSVANSTYHLYGTEAAEIRIRVREETTNAEDGNTSKLGGN